MMHTYGENGKEVQEYFKKVDAFIKQTYEKAKKVILKEICIPLYLLNSL